MPNALYDAIAAHDLPTVTRLLADGANCEAPGGYSKHTALMEASQRGHLDLVTLLLAHGVKLHARDEYGYTSLSKAAYGGHDAVVRLLIAHGADPWTGSRENKPILASAAAGGLLWLMESLLSRGDEIITQIPQALATAAEHGREPVVRLLLAHGAPLTGAVLCGACAGGLLWLAQACVAQGVPLDHEDDLHHMLPLHHAAQAGDYACVAWLIAQGANATRAVSTGYDRGKTALHCLAEAKVAPATILAIATLLIEHGTPLEANSEYHKTALYHAAYKNNGTLAEFLLAHGAAYPAELDFNFGDDLREQPFIAWAAARGHTAIVRTLLARGIPPDTHDTRHGVTLLHRAARHGHAETIAALLDAGADIEARDTYYQRTPLHLAARSGKADAVRVLLARGADAWATDKDNATALHFACAAGPLETVAHLLTIGPPDCVNLTTKFKERPLYAALSGNQPEIASFLIAQGARAIGRDSQGQSPLQLAVKYPTVLQELLQKSAQLKQKSQALRTACSLGQQASAEILLAAGADPNDPGTEQRTALHFAALNGHTALVELMLAHGADPTLSAKQGTALAYALEADHLAAAAPLLTALQARGANMADAHGVGSLYRALRTNNYALAQLVLTTGADPNRTGPGETNLLLLAARRKDSAFVELLLARGVNTTRDDAWGRTALHIALAEQVPASALALIAAGAPLNRATRAGYTPLHYAARHGYEAVVHALLERGAKPSATIRTGKYDGWTARDFADENGHSALSALLAARGVPGDPARATAAPHHTWIARACPVCAEMRLHETDYLVLHGNPYTPASDTEVEFHYHCAHCDTAFWAPEGSLRRLFTTGTGPTYEYNYDAERWSQS